MADAALDSSLKIALDLHRAGRTAEAEAEYRRLIKFENTNAEVWHFLGVLLGQTGRPTEGVAMMRLAIGMRPDIPEFHCNLGGTLGALGRYDEAVCAGLRAVELAPHWALAHHNLAVSLERTKRFEKAIEAYRNAITLDPNYAEAHDHLGNALRKMGRIGEAIECHRQAITIRPEKQYYDHLGWCLLDAGLAEQAVEAFRGAVRLDPGDAVVHSNLLFAMQHQFGITAEQAFSESLNWARRHAHPRVQQSHGVSAPASRGDARLRIGYVSADFRSHAVARFFEPLLENHDRNAFEVFCYSNSARSDVTTERLKALAGTWREIALLRDREAAGLIHEDRIDILVDLSGHTHGNRLPLFGWRAAPVQVSYLGYPATTGMDCIDYRITDAVADPLNHNERYTEKLIRLPGCAWSYRPSPNSPPVSPLPAHSSGGITFAALHRSAKLSSPLLATWGRLMAELPGSRLLLSVRVLCEDDVSIRRRLGFHGIDPDRVELVARRDHDGYLESYCRADVALDAFPYNGTTTTCDALWMGLPVVTLCGDRHVSRTGASLLRHMGHAEWVVDSEAAYVDATVSLTNNLGALSDIRSQLRERTNEMLVSNASTLTRNLEHQLRSHWMGAVGNIRS